MKFFVSPVIALLCAVSEGGSFKELVTEEPQYLELSVLPELLAQGGSHYGDPSDGCASDEVAVRIQGVQGAICSPKCDGMECPSDVPEGCEAQPQCMLQDAASGSKYCALACTKGTKCGAGASCQILFPGIGICTYN